MSFEFESNETGLNDPAADIFEITPNDSTDITVRAILSNADGDIAVRTRAGNNVVIPQSILSAGLPLPVQVDRVLATGTTATVIYGLK